MYFCLKRVICNDQSLPTTIMHLLCFQLEEDLHSKPGSDKGEADRKRQVKITKFNDSKIDYAGDFFIHECLHSARGSKCKPVYTVALEIPVFSCP